MNESDEIQHAQHVASLEIRALEAKIHELEHEQAKLWEAIEQVFDPEEIAVLRTALSDKR